MTIRTKGATSSTERKATECPRKEANRSIEHVRRRGSSSLAKNRARWFYLMILLWLIGFVVFQAGPILASLGLSVFDYHFTTGLNWVGLRHYASLLDDDLVWKTLANTAYYTFGSVPLSLVAGFGLALLLNQKVRGVAVFRTIFYLPSVITGVAVMMLWSWVFNPRFGIVNNLLDQMGIRGPGWLSSEEWAMPALIIMSLWSVGWMMLVYLAGLQGIPQELYEVAEIDGASWYHKLRYITIPLISPVTFFLLVMGIIQSMQVFVPTYVLTRGGPNNATMTVSLLIYFLAFAWDKMGYASALAVVLFLLTMAATLVQFVLGKSWVYYTTEVD